MNRISALFEQKKSRILSFYYTAGYPQLEDTVPILQQLEAGGADMVEIGIPFSDPMADGPVIQQSSAVALSNGMSLPELFRQLKHIRRSVSIPLLLMGYLNPVMQYGLERFCSDAAACGIDGLIIPDLPPEACIEHWKAAMDRHRLHMIFLVTPRTPPERIQFIDEHATGFIYMVTAAAVTGKRWIRDRQVQDYFRAVSQMKLRNPLIAGFGISSREDVDYVCRYTRGAVIGSQLIRTLEKYREEKGDLIRNYVQSFN